MFSSALFLVTVSAFIHAIWNFFVKKTSGNFAVTYLGILTSLVLYLPFSFIPITETVLNGASIFYVLVSGSFLATYYLALINMYRFGEFSSIYPVARGLGVLGAVIAATMILKEDLSSYSFIAVCLIAVGTLLSGLKGKIKVKGLWFSLVLAVSIVGFSLSDKSSLNQIEPLVHQYGKTLVAFFWLSLYVFFERKKEVKKAWSNFKKEILIIGIGSFGAYLLVLKALTDSTVSYVIPLRELSIMIGAAMGVFLLKEKLSFYKTIGVVFIFVGVIMVNLFK